MKDFIPIMSTFPGIKKLAEEHGFKAEYVPIVGAIEILCDDIAIGISHDGVKVKDNLTRKYHYLKPWIKTCGKTKTFLESFNGFFNERRSILKT